MPIEIAVPVQAATKDEFYDLDFAMLAQAYQIHSEYGGVLDEAVYKTELARRCVTSGILAEREVLVRVRHRSFFKDYRIDLLLDRKFLVEAKTVAQITQAHHGQTANYLMLVGLHHGSIVNFKGASVRRQFVSAPQEHDERCRFETKMANWPLDEAHRTLRDITLSLCGDLGLSLDTHLYRTGIAHLVGGLAAGLTEVPIHAGNVVIGSHPMHLLSEGLALAVTCLEHTRQFRGHLRKLISHTTLAGISWINLRRHVIEFDQVART